MKKLPAVMVGLAFVVASCAPAAAPTPQTESLTPTVSPTNTAEVKEPTATATTKNLSEEEISAPTSGIRNFQPQLEQISIDLNEVVTLLPPDAIPAVLPERAQEIMVTAAEADAAGIDPSVQVIGVEINGQSRAYPVPFMSRHEIVNDEVGGRLIAATW